MAGPGSDPDGEADGGDRVTPPEEQARVIAFLAGPAAWSPLPERVEHIETHGAHVFLAGEEALKIKRAVRYSYMDFSSLEKRRRACEREVEINRPNAPSIYLGTRAITADANGRLAIGGAGQVVEWAVHMRRFDQDALLSRLARRGPLAAGLVKSLAASVLEAHRRAAPDRRPDPVRASSGLIEDLGRQLAAAGDAAVGRLASEVAAHARLALERNAGLLERRRQAGSIRRCHGDLHLNNIVLLDGHAMLFDALEFDDALATVDILYDLAFLLMDLDAVDRRREANLLLGHYLWLGGAGIDLAGLAALPLFLALRAAIRAMVGLQRAALTGRPSRAPDGLSPLDYLSLARAYLDPPAPRLVAVGGFSGTGKSTLAAALAPRFGAAPGALHLRSDLERKHLAGVGECDRLSPDAYSAAASAAVYDRLMERARLALAAGHSVIVDAVFAREAEREAMAAVASGLGLRLEALWLTASPAVMAARVGDRRGDASDATPEVALGQVERGAGHLAWTVIAADGAPQEVFGRALEKLGLNGRNATPSVGPGR